MLGFGLAVDDENFLGGFKGRGIVKQPSNVEFVIGNERKVCSCSDDLLQGYDMGG